jgi:hypothetical protein
MAKSKKKVVQKSAKRRMHTGVTPCGITYHVAEEITMSALQAMHEKLSARIAARAAVRAQEGAQSTPSDADEH